MLLIYEYLECPSTVPPMVLVSPVNATVIEGEDGVFMCRVTGRPRPSIVWFYLESLSNMSLMTTPPPLNETDGNYSVDREAFGDRELESNLTVIRTLPSDTGFYVCFAANAVDGGISIVNGFLLVEGQQFLSCYVVYDCYVVYLLSLTDMYVQCFVP